MNGIDISHWQKGLDLSKIKCDFVIAKATEGINYLDPCFEGFMRQAMSLGKCLGFYHFARPEKNDARAEALYFYNNTVKYFGKGIPILDWESAGLANIAWAKEWLDRVQEMTGIKPMIYTGEYVVKTYDWSKVAEADYGLWIAKYRDHVIDKNYDMSNAGNKPVVKWWKFYAMWQWTSSGRLDGYNGNLDCDVFYGDRETWAKYAGAYNKKTYTVKDGDKLTDIAKRLETNVDDLARENALIYAGQVLRA